MKKVKEKDVEKSDPKTFSRNLDIALQTLYTDPDSEL